MKPFCDSINLCCCARSKAVLPSCKSCNDAYGSKLDPNMIPREVTRIAVLVLFFVNSNAHYILSGISRTKGKSEKDDPGPRMK